MVRRLTSQISASSPRIGAPFRLEQEDQLDQPRERKMARVELGTASARVHVRRIASIAPRRSHRLHSPRSAAAAPVQSLLPNLLYETAHARRTYPHSLRRLYIDLL